MSNPSIRLLIADDHAHFRAGIRALLLTEADMELIGEAATGNEAVAYTALRQPDVVLMDLNMPGMNGIEATRQIVFGSPHIAVLVISMFEDDDSVFAALQAGARGYLLKGAPKAEVLRSIRAVASGEAIFGAAIARRVMGYFATARPGVPANLFPELTEREVEILRLLAQHKSNGEIAAQLVLTDKTVRNYVSNICTKLQVVDRAEAILRARNAGLGAKYGLIVLSACLPTEKLPMKAKGDVVRYFSTRKFGKGLGIQYQKKRSALHRVEDNRQYHARIFRPPRAIVG